MPRPSYSCVLPCSRTAICVALWLFRSGSLRRHHKSAGAAILLAPNRGEEWGGWLWRAGSCVQAKRGLRSVRAACECCCLVRVETRGELCNGCNHLKRLAECVSMLNILFWGFFTWSVELCLEFFPLRLWLTCVYRKKAVKLGNKHFILICLRLTRWDFASP